MRISKYFIFAVAMFSFTADAVEFYVLKKDKALWIVYQEQTLAPTEVLDAIEFFIGTIDKKLTPLTGNASITCSETKNSTLLEFPSLFDGGLGPRDEDMLLISLCNFLERKFRVVEHPLAVVVNADLNDEAVVAERIRANERVIYGRLK